ncbi:MAG TPA: CdaR family protein [Longimicrobiales bacterium]|nr:CdaR family protein [Longimicrobiales bacterium]
MRWVLDLFVRNWTLKLTALVMAFLLWIAVRSETPSRASISGINVDVELQQEGWIFLPPPRPDTVSVVFEGPLRHLAALAIDRPRIIVPVTEVSDSVVTRTLDFRHLRYRGSRDLVRPVTIEPSTVTLRFDRLIEASRPVALVLTGELPEGRTLEGPPVADPPVVRVSGASRDVARLDSLRLVPLDLTSFTTSATVRVAVDTTGLGALQVTPAVVQVHVPVRSEPDTLASDTLPPDSAPLPADSAPPPGPPPDTLPPAPPGTPADSARPERRR